VTGEQAAQRADNISSHHALCCRWAVLAQLTCTGNSGLCKDRCSALDFHARPRARVLTMMHTDQPAGLPNNDIAVAEAHQNNLRDCTVQLQVRHANHQIIT
jgi:hypothetical protein